MNSIFSFLIAVFFTLPDFLGLKNYYIALKKFYVESSKVQICSQNVLFWLNLSSRFLSVSTDRNFFIKPSIDKPLVAEEFSIKKRLRN